MLRNRENGQSIIIIAAALLVLLALVALVVDIGNAYAHRRMVQNAVDAAALAGARRLANRYVGEWVTEIEILNDIETYAEENGLEREAVEGYFIDAEGDVVDTIDRQRIPPPANAEGVRVDGDLPFNTYFAPILGFPEMTAATTANAWVLFSPCSAGNLFPLTVNTSMFTETTGVPVIGEVYTLWDHKDKRAPGNWGWLYWEDGDGICRCPDEEDCCPQNAAARNLEDNIEDNTRSGYWRVGDWVSGGSGVMMGGVLDRLFPYAENAWPEVIIPLYDQMVGTGDNVKYRIAGFAAFRLRCVYSASKHYADYRDGDCAPCQTGSSDDKCIRGEFVRKVIPSGEDGCIDTGVVIPSFRKPLR